MAGRNVRVHRVDFGYFVRPGPETSSGTDRVEPVLGYVVTHPQGVLLLDTGMGAHPEVDRHYRPRRVALPSALSAVGYESADIDLVVNCHLHFDHCGNNPALVHRPILVQSAELSVARSAGYTLPELLDAPGLAYEELTGDADVWDGVQVIQTPGHTAGHQSVVVRQEDGTVIVLAGQSHDTATQYSADALAMTAARDGHFDPLPMPPEWLGRLQALDPARVYFAHDHSVWVP